MKQTTHTKMTTSNNKAKKKSLPQTILFLVTGFLLSQFFLLNVLYTQHPQGGWVTPFGSVSTVALISVNLFAIMLCLISLWRSSSNKPETSTDYSIPTIFTKVSPE